jgi:UDP-N-acetylglucosamine--N-acetylmuramyl-(pentapeptide) pyrophosphoryl-undecaprenol N-acetylglucosamine transferase
MSKRILFTGGGSAGHVTVNAALIPRFIRMGWDVHYMGSLHGIEADLVKRMNDVEYVGISTGKLRRYLDWQNVKDPFRVVKGCYQAFRIIRKMKPDVVFSKGGFVSVPVVLGAWLNKVPIIIHESDLTPGLANRIAMPFATKICTTFPDTIEHVPHHKATHIGAIVREELRNGHAAKGLTMCGFTKTKPIILVMGGSLGSQRINSVLRRNLNRLIREYQIVHICGKGQIDASIHMREYKQFEYITTDLPDIMAMSDLVVSRAGSNSIFEFLALHKPMLLIPLSQAASRGDQILNARSFEKQGLCEVLLEEEMNDETVVDSIQRLYAKRHTIMDQMDKYRNEDMVSTVVELIKRVSKKS